MALAWLFLQSKVLPEISSVMVIDLYPPEQKLRDVHAKVVISLMSLLCMKPTRVSNLSVDPKVIVAVKSFFPSDQVSVFEPTLYFFAQLMPASSSGPPMLYNIGKYTIPLTETLSLTGGKSLQL
jgi:hypothetical protein